MGKYTKYQRPSLKQKPQELHPVWRGIGCMLWVIVPLMAYASAVLIVGAMAPAGMLPAGVLGRIQFPDWVYAAPVLGFFAAFINSLDNLTAILIFFVIFVVILTGLATTLYAMLYRMIGPPRYTAVDAPPTGKRAGKESR